MSARRLASERDSVGLSRSCVRFASLSAHQACGQDSSGILAERQGSDPADIGVRALGAALSASLYVALDDWQASDGIDDLGGLIDRTLASLDGHFGSSKAGSHQNHH